jgi:hypothetical protein
MHVSRVKRIRITSGKVRHLTFIATLLIGWSILGVFLLWTGAADADQNDNLKGSYAFTGEATCLVSLSGFNSKLTPIDGRFVQSFNVQGVWTFFGNGTGARTGRSVGITHPTNFTTTIDGGAGSDNFQASFTYNVASDGTFTTTLSGPLTGTVLTGTRAGQTFTIDQLALNGLISQDRKSLTIANDQPTIEVVTYSNGDIHHRICHRSRALFRLKGGDD